jgi:ADP-ribosylglycohydrolase
MITQESIINSMLWASYGDAIGYITELCDDKENLKYRTFGQTQVTELIKWRRKLGGQYGLSIELPLGCYSDDTQLRLAVCRSINKNGNFDFETFSKIELPVFLAYGLGVGKGTRNAGESLIKKNIQWNTNFFETTESNYLKGGGNGAAMRIQPHVWSCSLKTSNMDLTQEVFRNVIITHGHPIAWVGAVFHALTLRETLLEGYCPPPDKWENILDETRLCLDSCQNDPLLKDIWIPNWERITGIKIAEGIDDAIEYMRKDILLTKQLIVTEDNTNLPNNKLYINLLERTDAFNPKLKGSATKTVLLSTYIAHAYREDPMKGIELCANALKSDTDTIGTMAGALLGACSSISPPQKPLDYDYQRKEAQRLFDISCGKEVYNYTYPDLLQWGLPKSQIDYMGYSGDKFAIYGLGILEPIGEPITQGKGLKITYWRFFKTSYDQTLLLRYREKPKDILLEYLPHKTIRNNTQKENERSENMLAPRISRSSLALPEQSRLFDELMNKNLDDITDRIIKNGFDNGEIGKQLLSYAEKEDGLERAIAFSTIIVKAKRARLKKQTSNGS